VDFGFNVAEIELMIADQSGAQRALEKILAFAALHGLYDTPIGGKIMEYIRRHRPEHYQALVAAGIAGKA
jgi:hypothetical protein